MASNYPVNYDTNSNLYQVRDGLRVVLAEDYNPGDTSITVLADETTMRLFSNTGIITLTEQCSDIEFRALSFSYTSRTLTTFDGLTLLSGFIDSVKPKNRTNVTQNVMAEHHNAIKDALIASQLFAGKKGEIGTKPLVGTMEERVNYVRQVAFQPKAWFNVDKTVGIAPLTVTFTDQSFRLGTDGVSSNIQYFWDFGDNTTSLISYISVISGVSNLEVVSVVPSVISLISYVPNNISNVIVEDIDGATISKVYTEPGIYTVKLRIVNDFGEDEVVFHNLIEARFPAPSEACISFVLRANQFLSVPGVPTGGPYVTTPVIRAPANSIIDMYVPSGINPNTPGVSYGGETVIDGKTIDSIEAYTWSLSDDLAHGNSSLARAVFSIGGTYDLILRCDTDFGAYRITTYNNAFDIVEKYNLWLWLYNSSKTQASVSEFGLLSETFKTTVAPLTLNVNDNFLVNTISNPVLNSDQQLREFRRNVGFAPRTTASSGNAGTGLLYWASGRSPASSSLNEKIFSSEFNGFTQVYTTGFTKIGGDIQRPWNWLSLASLQNIYFILGGVTGAIAPSTSPTNQTKDVVSLSTLTATNPASVLTAANYLNGADELMQNEVTYNESGLAEQGNMSIYRGCWFDDAGYFLRNQGTGTFFRIKSFYKTSGNTSEPFLNIRKLPDMAGPSRVEGQLVPLSTGVFFFSNSGSVAAYNPTTGVWSTGGPGVNSPAFRSLQDSSVIGFDNEAQTLLASSDNDKIAYLSFDYSTKAFIKFNENDTTFSNVTIRPTGNQWNMTIF